MSDTTNPTPEDEQQVPESTERGAASSGVTIESLGEQLVAAQAELSKRGQGMRRSTNITVGIGIVLIALMVGYFSYGLSEIETLSDPAFLLPLVQTQLQANNLPTDLDDALGMLRREGLPTNVASLQEWLDEQIAENAPVIAKQFSDQAVEMAPSIRLVVEDYAVEQMRLLVDQGTAFTADKFGQMVDENRVTIESAMNDLAENEKLSEATMTELIGLLEAELGTDIQEQAGLVLGTLKALNAKLDRLANAEDLNEEEQAERAALMIARRLLVEQQAVSVNE
tara:strand:+ start:29 stop:874 length:846 start_codon:yes stop_codon:yes gene_type:complete